MEGWCQVGVEGAVRVAAVNKLNTMTIKRKERGKGNTVIKSTKC